ncbi:MAG: SufS family cysteine desulfurase [Candidatus Kapaibacterium sp.]
MSEVQLKEIKTQGYDINKIREDFPNLLVKVHGRDLVYLDNAATTHKPQSVIDKTVVFYKELNSNIHRGVHKLSQTATFEYEAARKTAQNFLNAGSSREIIFTKGTTESANLLANSFGKKYIKEGDEIIISHMEHHSNIVPWQMLCEEKNARLRVIPINDKGELIYEEFEKMISEKAKLVSVVHVSNSLGTINPIKKIIDKAHEYCVPVAIDGAQSVHHLKVDVRELDCDFFMFSGHKIYGPTGIGILYGKEKFLEDMPPYQGGGDMIKSVSFEKTIYNDLPFKYEAGTQNIAGAIGLGAALEYITALGLENIASHEHKLLEYAAEQLKQLEGLKIIGEAASKAAVVSFILEDVHPHDIGTMLDMDGVAVRTGHHCTEPVMRHFGIPATTRASFAIYNTPSEINVLINSLKKVIRMFA